MFGGHWCPVALTVALVLGVSACTGSPSTRDEMPSAAAPRSGRPVASPTSSRGGSPPRPTAVPIRRVPRGSSHWRLRQPAKLGQIEGYADPGSVAPGQSLRLMVSTSASRFRVFAYRIGGYRGGAGRLVWASGSLPGRRQRAPGVSRRTRTVSAGWSPSTSVATTGWPPGFYLLKLVASSGHQAHIPLVVRSRTTHGRVTLVAPTMTWEAYNAWGGYSLYEAPSGRRRSWAVSFARPNEPPGAGEFVHNVVGAVALAERLGLPLAYEADTDIATRPGLLRGATGYVSLGHDEYWTVPERRHVTAARDSGTNLAFLSSNTSYWRVRLRPADTSRSYVVVGYKTDATTADPLRRSDPARTTARWRDPPHPDPENSLTGTLYECFPVDQPYRVVTPHWWAFRGTGVRAGTQFPHLVAQEADRVYPLPSTPRPLQILSHISYSCGGVPTSAESIYYTTPSGSGVIDFGTQRWACAVQRHCPDVSPKGRAFVRQVMTNVLREFARGPVGRKYPARDNITDYPLPRTNQVPAS
jgi:hypothetical protein